MYIYIHIYIFLRTENTTRPLSDPLIYCDNLGIPPHPYFTYIKLYQLP